MKFEIERKFLLKNDSWKGAVVSATKLSDGLLSDAQGNKIRVRLGGANGTITIKGPAAGFSRAEFEYEVPLAEAKFMLLNLCSANVCSKIRYAVAHSAHVWHVDVYEDILAGFVIAEIELADQDENFALPDWIGPEVTGDPNYGKWAALARCTAAKEIHESIGTNTDHSVRPHSSYAA